MRGRFRMHAIGLCETLERASISSQLLLQGDYTAFPFIRPDHVLRDAPASRVIAARVSIYYGLKPLRQSDNMICEMLSGAPAPRRHRDATVCAHDLLPLAACGREALDEGARSREDNQIVRAFRDQVHESRAAITEADAIASVDPHAMRDPCLRDDCISLQQFRDSGAMAI